MKPHKEETADMQDRKVETHYLAFKFSDAEVLSLGRDLAKLQQDLEDAETAKAALTSEFAGKIKTMKKELELLARKVRDGFEFRHIKCVVVGLETKRKRKILIREDTGEELDVPATPADLQETLSGLA